MLYRSHFLPVSVAQNSRPNTPGLSTSVIFPPRGDFHFISSFREMRRFLFPDNVSPSTSQGQAYFRLSSCSDFSSERLLLALKCHYLDCPEILEIHPLKATIKGLGA